MNTNQTHRTRQTQRARRSALLLAGLTLLGACSGGGNDGGADDTTSSSTTAPSGASTSTTTPEVPEVIDIVSPEVDDIEIDAPDTVIPPDPTAPPDEFALGSETPLDPLGRPYLQQGDEGDDVAAMQRRLIKLGYRVDDSGVFDDATLAAVLSFQAGQGLVTDGVVGKKTWAALDKPEPVTPGGNNGNKPGGTGDGATIPPVEPPPTDPAVTNPAPDVTRAVIELATQRATLFAGDRAVATFLVSSGRNGLTPVGTFRVQSKSSVAWAGSDPSISMKWMTRFNGGIGFHGIPVKAGVPLDTPLGERPVSAGCIRMADADAKRVFDLLPIGATVIVR